MALTANVLPSNVKQCHDIGIRAVIPKPFKRELLYQVMDEQLDRHYQFAIDQQANNGLLNISLVHSHLAALGKQRLQKLVTLFSSAMERGLDEMAEMNAQQDMYELADIAHRLAGDADAVGAQTLADAFRAMETHCNVGTDEDFGADIAALRPLYEATLTLLEDKLKTV